ncbi:hypothetical protein DFP73DRAFT_593968 [Morchella snyderi]|nr:hypothetical protein DFP73DRAFT_593968 [Morchella snyderi]
MSNTWKGRSRQNQEATLEVIKDNLREKIREKKGITIEVIPEDGFSEDDEALAADLAAFRNARKRWFTLNFGALKRKRKAKRMKRSKKRGITKKVGRKRMCRAPVSAVESTAERFGGECFGEHGERFGGECFGEHGERFGGECFGEHWERFGGECFGEHKRVLWSVSSRTYIPILYSISELKTSSMPGKNRALKGKTRCVGVGQLQQAISGATGERASGVSRRYVAVSGERALRRDGVSRKSILWQECQAKEHSVGIESGERTLRWGEHITIGAREKPSIRLGTLGTLVRARAECFTPEHARSILLLLWRGSLSTERPQRLAEAPGSPSPFSGLPIGLSLYPDSDDEGNPGGHLGGDPNSSDSEPEDGDRRGWRRYMKKKMEKQQRDLLAILASHRWDPEPSLPTTASRGRTPKAPPPSKFQGKAEQIDTFLRQCENVFSIESLSFTQEEIKIHYAGNLMEGPAAIKWYISKKFGPV